MNTISTRWAITAGLQCLVATVIHALPASVIDMDVFPDFRMRFEVASQQVATDLEVVMRCLEDTLLQVGDTFYENPPVFWQQKDNDVNVWDLGVPGYALGMFAPGRNQVTWMEEVVLPYGALKWAQLWKEVGWLPRVNFSATWTNPHLPGGRSETTGSMGFEQLPQEISTHIGRFNATSSMSVRSFATSKKYRTRSSTNSTTVNLPRDPWQRQVGHLNDVTFFNFRGQYFAASDMVSMAVDCCMQNLFEFGLTGLDDGAEPISAQPLIYGPQGGLRIFAKSLIRTDPDNHEVLFDEVDSITKGAVIFYREFASAGRGWAPSVDVLVKGYDGHVQNKPLDTGWIGRPLVSTR